MIAIRIVCLAIFSSCLPRAKVLHGKNMQILIILFQTIQYQSIFTHVLCDKLHIGSLVPSAIFKDKMPLLITFQLLFYPDPMWLCSHHTCPDRSSFATFKARKRFPHQQVIKRLKRQNIGIQIDSAFSFQCPQANIIAHKCEFPRFVCLFYVWN